MKESHFEWSKSKRCFGSPICHAIYTDNDDLKNFLLSQSNINLNGKLYIQINLNNDDEYDKINIETNILLMAIKNGDIDLVRYLFTKNDIDFISKYKIKKYCENKIIKSKETSVFDFAIKKGNLEIVQYLYSKKEIDIKTTALDLAIDKNKDKITEFLLSKKEILDYLSIKYDDLFLKAVDKNNYEIVNLLLIINEIISNKKNLSETLYHTIATNNIQLMQLLLTKEDIKDTFLHIFNDLLIRIIIILLN